MGVPCITLREETEWTETVDAGWNVLVGTQSQLIIAAVNRPAPEPVSENPYGNGDAATRIAQSL